MKEELEKKEFLPYFISLREFAAGIAHEINNPLSSLMAVIEYLSLYKEAEAFKDELEIMKNSARRILNIIREIILFSETQSDSEKEIFEVNNAVQSLISIIKNYYYSEGVEIIEKYESDKFFIFGRRGIFQNAILNLLKNSYDAIKGIRDKGKIEVEIKGRENYVLIKVQDNGKGISRDDREKIFIPFFTTKSHKEGMGMGLNFVKKVVDELKGKIYFETHENIGTSFYMEIPLYKVKKGVEEDNYAILYTRRSGVKTYIKEIMTKLKWKVRSVEDLGRMVEICRKCEAKRCVVFIDLKALEIPYHQIIEKFEMMDKKFIQHLVFVMDSFEPDWLNMVRRKGIKFICEPFTVGEILQVI